MVCYEGQGCNTSAKGHDLETPRKEWLYSYIKGKTERLQARRGQVAKLLIFASILLPLCIPLRLLKISEVVQMLVIIFASGMSLTAIANMHVDLLGILKRDLDRDEAEDLIGFETPE